MEVQVCVGSACHLKGSYEVVEKLKKLVGEDNVKISGSFCCGTCGDPRVSVKVNDELFHVAVSEVEAFYEKEIRSRL